MGLQQQQNLLARLYTDADFRRAFLFEPEKIGAENDLTADEISEIAAIMPEELNFFADSLFQKRLREAEKFLPLTRNVLGGDFSKLFREFSRNFNPQSVKKHFEDALAFCRFLRDQTIADSAKTAAKFEQAKLEFFGLEKRFAFCRLDFDVRKISECEPDNPPHIPEKKKIIAVWLRIGRRIRHFYI